MTIGQIRLVLAFCEAADRWFLWASDCHLNINSVINTHSSCQLSHIFIYSYILSSSVLLFLLNNFDYMHNVTRMNESDACRQVARRNKRVEFRAK
jgi:hypothetical protein